MNGPLAEEMLACVLSHIAGAQNLKILELYSGVGYFSRFLAEQASQLTAIESSASACYDFVSNLDCFDTVSLYEGGVEQILPGLLTEIDQPDLVVLDPPRSGLHPRAREALIKLNSPKIIYISCDPSTLARDIKALCAAGYTLDDVRMFDMFPQTFHLEMVAVMTKVQAVADA